MYTFCSLDFSWEKKESAFKSAVLPQLCYACEEAGDPFELQATSQVPGIHFSVPLVLHQQPKQRGSSE